MINNLENGIRKYVGGKKVVVGISGGIDSAVCATLAVNAIGKDNVIGLLMPASKDGMKIANELGIKTKEINIKPILESFMSVDFSKDRIAIGNLKARIRMCLLYWAANSFDALVMGTSNKSEIEIGYFTKYGDGVADFLPIGDVLKTDVKKLAMILNIPKHIIDKSPSAELWDGQTDENEIGFNYDEIDSFLKGSENDKLLKMTEKNKHKKCPFIISSK